MLVYAAYRNRSPLDILRDVQGPPPFQTARRSPTAFEQEQPQAYTDVAGAGQGWVMFGHGALRLQPAAAASFKQVEACYGRTIHLTGAGRSYSEQLAGYLRSPGTFADPRRGPTAHMQGRAVDINTGMNLDDPLLVNCFQKHGWYRQGKTISWKGTRRHEPWHWSYGSPG